MDNWLETQRLWILQSQMFDYLHKFWFMRQCILAKIHPVRQKGKGFSDIESGQSHFAGTLDINCGHSPLTHYNLFQYFLTSALH